MRILLTRPVPESERTAQHLAALGHTSLIAPMLNIEAVADAAIGPGPWGAVLMTSGNAARALTAHPRCTDLLALRCFAVGAQTAKAARETGFAEVVSADGDGGDLARRVQQDIGASDLPLLYLAGNDLARDLAGELRRQGLRVETVVVYRAVAAQSLPHDVMQALGAGRIDAVLHYSRRSAAIFLDCARASGVLPAVLTLAHCCLSERASEPVRAAGAASVHVASRPDEPALLDLLAGM